MVGKGCVEEPLNNLWISIFVGFAGAGVAEVAGITASAAAGDEEMGDNASPIDPKVRAEPCRCGLAKRARKKKKKAPEIWS
jgi:hypothetical protein